MQTVTFILGLFIGIMLGILCMISTEKLRTKGAALINSTGEVVGKWKMPDDIATIEPLKPSTIEIAASNGGYQLIQGLQTTKLKVDGQYLIPVSSGAPIEGITYRYDATDDVLIQEIGGHPFSYTRE